VDNAIAVALKIVAVGMGRLGMAASAGVFDAHRIVGEHGKSLAGWFTAETPRSPRKTLVALPGSSGRNLKYYSAASASRR
jgi:hypothetical protein